MPNISDNRFKVYTLDTKVSSHPFLWPGYHRLFCPVDIYQSCLWTKPCPPVPMPSYMPLLSYRHHISNCAWYSCASANARLYSVYSGSVRYPQALRCSVQDHRGSADPCSLPLLYAFFCSRPVVPRSVYTNSLRFSYI